MESKTKKVLQITTTPLQYDGLTKVIFSLVDNVKEPGLIQEIVLTKGGLDFFKEELKKRGITYHELPDRQEQLSEYRSALRNLLKSDSYDVVHVHGNSATMAIEMKIAKKCGVPIRIAHSHNTKTDHPFVHKVLKGSLRRNSNAPVACGRRAGEFLFGSGFSIIPNCVKVDDFQYNEEIRAKVREELGIGDAPLLGHVGRFSFQKNHERLIDIFNKVQKQKPDAKLLLVGEGELEEEIRERVHLFSLEDKVIFYGVSNRVNELMQAMDVFLLPSRFEGLSVTAIEAQAAGLFVCMSDKVSTETDKSGNCSFIPVYQDLSIWTDTVINALDNPPDRLEGAKRVRENGYDISNLRQKVKEIWQID